jgi:hypothetical protein
MTVDEISGKIYIFGGRSKQLTMELNDLHSYDIYKMRWDCIHPCNAIGNEN